MIALIASVLFLYAGEITVEDTTEKFCIYEGAGQVYTIVVEQTELCPMSIEVDV